jgi:uncharacterized protein (DUF1501 family)
MVTRREFLTHVGASGGVLCLGNLAPRMWAQAAAATQGASDQPLLVVIELDGGNDGLNMVVPFADDIYHRNRPTLRVAADKVLKLDDHLGLHPAMTGLAKLWEQGQLRVANSVGYPNPNRSHGRALDIWRSGSVAVEPTGWLGRAADQNNKLSLCHVGDGEIPLAMRQRLGAAISIGSLDDFHLRAGAQITSTESTACDPAIAQIAARINAAGALAQRMNFQSETRGHSAATVWTGAGSDQPAPLVDRLAIVKTLMEQGAGFRIYYTGTTGFDTHANQGNRHRRLLTEVSEAISGFLRDIGKSALGERVIVLVFSEFGRRLRENGQQGTDHGAAAPVLLAGQPVNGGFLGGPPNLTQLDAGDVVHKIDYRDLYASLLQQWLKIDPAPILGARDTSLELI